MIIKLSVRQALREAGQNQGWLAAKLKVRETKLSRWINSEHLSTSIIEQIAKAFNMRVGEFISLGDSYDGS